MAEEKVATKEKNEAPKPQAPKAPALTYAGSSTLAKPVKVDVLPSPVRTGGGPGGGPTDIRTAFDAIVEFRGDWFKVAEGVGNPGRFYDGFRALGATVKVNQNGETKAIDKSGKEVTVKAYDVYAMVEHGDLKPWKKASAKSKKEKDGSGVQEKGTVEDVQARQAGKRSAATTE